MNTRIKRALQFFFGVPALFVLQTPPYLLGSYCYFVLVWFIYTNFQRTQEDKSIIDCIARALGFSFLSFLVCAALYQVAFALTLDESLDHYIDKTVYTTGILHILTVFICIALKTKTNDITSGSTE